MPSTDDASSHFGHAERLPLSVVAPYTAGSIGTGIFSTVPTVLLLYYCTEVLGISAAIAGALIFLPKAWALFWDPFVGNWSDRTRSRFGRRRPFMVVGAAGVGLTFVALFSASPGPYAVWHVAIAYFAMTTAYSLFAVPYIALPAEIAPEDRSRARLMTVRMAVVMIGVLIGAGLAPVLTAFGRDRVEGYAIMAIALALISTPAMLAPAWAMRGRDTTPQAASRDEGGLSSVIRDARFMRYVFAYVAMLVACGALTAAMPYFITRVAGRPVEASGVALAVVMIASIPGMGGWYWLAHRLGTTATIIATCVWFGAVTAIGLPAAGSSWFSLLVVFALLGAGFGGLQLLPYILMSDIAAASAGGGVRNEGTFSGVWLAAEKVGLAAGPLATAIGLSIAGRAHDARSTLLVTAVPVVLAIAVAISIMLFSQRQARLAP